MSAPTTAMGYRASVDALGVMTIHDVPIFVACTRGDQVFDDEWIGKAVAKAKQAEGEGYLPPLHCGHHDAATRAGAKTVQSAGSFRVLGTQPIKFKGTERTAVLADLVITDESVQKAVLAQRLPYRSVEIFDVEAPPALDGLALLNHEAPFLELPMLLVNDVAECSNNSNLRPPWSVTHEGEESGDPVLALFRRGNSAFVLMRDNSQLEQPMTEQKKLFEKDEGDDEKKENMEDGGGALDATAVIKAISDGSISINDFDEIRAAMDSRGSEAVEEDEAALAPAPVPGAEAMRKEPAEMSAEFAAMKGEVEALRAKDVSRDEADQRSNDVAEALELLRDKPQGSDLPAVLTAFHKDCKGDPVVWKAYIDARNMAPYGNSDNGSAERFAGQSANVPDWAQKYLTDGGTGAADQAAKFCSEYDELKAHGFASGQTQERFVEINMAKINAKEA